MTKQYSSKWVSHNLFINPLQLDICVVNIFVIRDFEFIILHNMHIDIGMLR